MSYGNETATMQIGFESEESQRSPTAMTTVSNASRLQAGRHEYYSDIHNCTKFLVARHQLSHE
eukprot:scaffold322032_cov22-Prasinocladus_malaysianus.AAC.1